MGMMSRRAICVGLAGIGAGGLVVVRPARAATVVKVDLWDRGAGVMAMLGHQPMMGLGMPGMMGRRPAGHGPMGITAAPASARPGEVTFEVVNSSKEIVHEMIVAPLADPGRPLPYDPTAQTVDEEKAGHLGEVSELAPGARGVLTVTLKPGRYLLYCNVPGHYALGMWTEFDVSA